jgi:hypothetical protein
VNSAVQSRKLKAPGRLEIRLDLLALQCAADTLSSERTERRRVVEFVAFRKSGEGRWL